MFRKVKLPAHVAGQLFLHSMPGRHESLDDSIKEIDEKGISKVVSLTSLQEIEEISPEFAEAIHSHTFQINRISFPIEDYSIPSEPYAFIDLANDLATALKNGERILIHCAGGIGRTGTLAVSVLLSLGIEQSKARQLVKIAGSGPVTPEQKTFLNWVKSELMKVGSGLV